MSEKEKKVKGKKAKPETKAETQSENRGHQHGDVKTDDKGREYVENTWLVGQSKPFSECYRSLTHDETVDLIMHTVRGNIFWSQILPLEMPLMETFVFQSLAYLSYDDLKFVEENNLQAYEYVCQAHARNAVLGRYPVFSSVRFISKVQFLTVMRGAEKFHELEKAMRRDGL